MKFSSRGRYGLLLMLDLAVYDTGGWISLADASHRTGVTQKYLEQIVSALSRAGLVRSLRGTRGGYRLAAAPDRITAGQILRAMEGEVHPGPEKGEEQPPLDAFYQELNRRVDAYLDGVTLEQLRDEMLAQAGNDYVI